MFVRVGACVHVRARRCVCARPCACVRVRARVCAYVRVCARFLHINVPLFSFFFF